MSECQVHTSYELSVPFVAPQHNAHHANLLHTQILCLPCNLGDPMGNLCWRVWGIRVLPADIVRPSYDDNALGSELLNVVFRIKSKFVRSSAKVALNLETWSLRNPSECS